MNEDSLLKIAATGYVSTMEGSVAAANAVFVRELLKRGHGMTFHSKPGFVDPRPAIENCPGSERFNFVDCTNRFPRRLASYMNDHPNRLSGRMISAIEHNSYNRSISQSMRIGEMDHGNDVSLWLGTWAESRLAGIPSVSFVQGPPGTDARSIAKHRVLIERLTSRRFYLRMLAFAKWRLSTCLQSARFTDHVIVGSEWSKADLGRTLNVAARNISCLPYPIDLSLFQPGSSKRSADGPLRLLWLGRFVPRKRLDLFLDGLALAISHGIDVCAVVVGKSDFVPGFEKLIDDFKYQDRLEYRTAIPRTEVPKLLWQSDVLAQPSDDENFGSSVAEALACGLPAIVGATNGTADYLCPRSIRLTGDSPQEFASAIGKLADAKVRGELLETEPSRSVAKRHFDPANVTRRLESILSRLVASKAKATV